MTPARLNMIYNEWRRERRERGLGPTRWRDAAAFFRVSEQTVRRWRSGETPIPHSVELVLEILHRWPEVTSEEVDEVIRQAGAVETSR